MAVTGWKFASANSIVTNNSLAWSNPANAYADDTAETIGGPATSGPTDLHVWSNFGFTTADIPDGSTIDGIEVEIEQSSNSTGNTYYIDLQMYDGAANVGSAKTTSQCIYSWTTDTLGGAADLWGTTSANLDDADIRSTGFGITMISTGWTSWDGPWVNYLKVRIYYTEGTSDTNVAAAAEALTLTEHAATITQDFGVPAAAEALTLTGQAASIIYDVAVAAASEALSVTPLTAAITLDKDIGAAAEGLLFTTQPAVIVNDVGVNASTPNLTLTPLAAGITFSTGTVVGVVEFTLTTYPATIGQDLNLAMAAEGLVLTGLQAQIGLDIEVSAAAEALALTGLQAQVGLDQAVAASSAALSFTTHAASVVAGAEVDAAVAPLQLATQPASIDFDLVAGPEALTIAGQPATIDWQIGVFCADVTLTLTELAATLTYDVEISAEVKAMTFTTYSATVLGEVISTSRRVDPFASEISWNEVGMPQAGNLAEPFNSGSNSVTVSPPDDNEVEV